MKKLNSVLSLMAAVFLVGCTNSSGTSESVQANSNMLPTYKVLQAKDVDHEKVKKDIRALMESSTIGTIDLEAKDSTWAKANMRVRPDMVQEGEQVLFIRVTGNLEWPFGGGYFDKVTGKKTKRKGRELFIVASATDGRILSAKMPSLK